MTASAAHIREENDANESLKKALHLYKEIQDKGLAAKDPRHSLRRSRRNTWPCAASPI